MGFAPENYATSGVVQKVPFRVTRDTVKAAPAEGFRVSSVTPIWTTPFIESNAGRRSGNPVGAGLRVRNDRPTKIKIAKISIDFRALLPHLEFGAGEMAEDFLGGKFSFPVAGGDRCLRVWPVNKKVGNVKNDAPERLEANAPLGETPAFLQVCPGRSLWWQSRE
jgi:hypothetical protein